MYTEFYRLTGDPFRLTPDPLYTFAGKRFRRALASMQLALEQGEGALIVTGGSGTGKSTLVSSFLQRLKPGEMPVAHIVSSQLGSADVLRMVAYEFGVPGECGDTTTLLTSILDRLRAYSRSLLIVDEAQHLSESALEELRILTNLDHASGSRLQLFLVGQPSLVHRLNAPGMEQLHQRVTAVCKLEPLDIAETHALVMHRLARAGWQGNPALETAVFPLLHRSSQGLPLHIGKLCNRLLLHGALEQRSQLGFHDVVEVIAEFRDEGLLPPRNPVDGDILALRLPDLATLRAFAGWDGGMPLSEAEQAFVDGLPAVIDTATGLDTAPSAEPSALVTEPSAFGTEPSADITPPSTPAVEPPAPVPEPSAAAARSNSPGPSRLTRSTRYGMQSAFARGRARALLLADRSSSAVNVLRRVARRCVTGVEHRARTGYRSMVKGFEALPGPVRLAGLGVITVTVVALAVSDIGHSPVSRTATLESSTASSSVRAAGGEPVSSGDVSVPGGGAPAAARAVALASPSSPGAPGVQPRLASFRMNPNPHQEDTTAVYAAAGGRAPAEPPVQEPAPVTERLALVSTLAPGLREPVLLESINRVSITEALGPDEQIADLLARGERALTEDRLRIPESNSAWHFYNAVLAIDVGNSAARQGIERIANRYAVFAGSALERESYEQVRSYLDRGLATLPDHSELLAQQQALEARLTSLAAGRVEIQAAAQAAAEAADRLEKAALPEERPRNLLQVLKGLFGGDSAD